MNVHPTYGPSLEEHGWVPAPRYLLRRDRILSILRDFPLGRLLEVGCGAGTLLYDLKKMGFECEALEVAPEARRLAEEVHSDDPTVSIHECEKDSWHEHFDLITSFDVLEHIEDDRKALTDWANWIKKGGHLLISVPAHKRKFNDGDLWAGHFRRYDKEEFKSLLEEHGFYIEKFECYGFPLATMIEPVRDKLHARQLSKRNDPKNKQENTHQSGISRSIEAKIYPFQKSLPAVAIYKCFSKLQNLFLSTDLGSGYLVLAKKI